MNRLQKKCFVASAGVHLLLASILFIGPGFISSKSKPDNFTILNFVPARTVDELVTPGGGNPSAKPLPATPVQPPPQPQPAPPQPVVAQPLPVEKVREPEPVKEIKQEKPQEKEEKPQEDSLEPSKERAPKKIEISTKLITRSRDNNSDKKAREEAQARAEAKSAADARRRLARQFGQAAERLSSEMSAGVSLDMQGPGGGGPSYANFYQALKSVYDRAWVLPDGAVDDEATTVVSVTIARDGTVISSRIIRFSGDSVVDRSVQAALDRVRYAAPLPDNSKEDQRTVSINFNVKAKRLLG